MTQQPKPRFSKEAIDTFIAFGQALKEIHVNLLMQGWKIDKEKFVMPDGTVIYIHDKNKEQGE